MRGGGYCAKWHRLNIVSVFCLRSVVFLHPLDFPLVSYFVNWRDAAGLYIMGTIGVCVCIAACGACWYQIINDPGD